MQTDTIAAWQVEEGDYITLGSETVWQVAEVNDTTTGVDLILTDEDGETDRKNPVSFVAYESVQLVTNFDDEEVDMAAFDL